MSKFFPKFRYIDIRKRAVLDVRRNDVVLALLVDDGSLNVAVEKVERTGLVALDGEAIATEVQLRPPCEVILILGLLGAVLEVAVVDRFRAANVVETSLGVCER